ncbi:hypothetical protein PsYK624_152610 [Phanerochaete sordida]|uniref:Uncharacterized protein n=1 Tax=Phanerochaete sordida TaxID=48140 RepID=A0A9P3GQ39_9APHY|nr:hypothetical protein PsYK624_152610 [Phanerochaete sordida]
MTSGPDGRASTSAVIRSCGPFTPSASQPPHRRSARRRHCIPAPVPTTRAPVRAVDTISIASPLPLRPRSTPGVRGPEFARASHPPRSLPRRDRAPAPGHILTCALLISRIPLPCSLPELLKSRKSSSRGSSGTDATTSCPNARCSTAR